MVKLRSPRANRRTSRCSTAAVSFVNHDGDLGAVFKDLGSSASVKQLVTGMLTASAVTRLGNQIHFGGKPLARITVKDGFTAHLSKTLIEQSAGAAISSEWKGTNGTPMYVVEFSAKPGVGLREGQVGLMYDRLTSLFLPGGGHQVQFLNVTPQTSPNSFVIDINTSRRLAP
ncbi:MAG: DUF637 domain-containing protein [Hydrogenophaga sp.]|uniref:DUF637 domain-containing protein n=1 Tax=Hydrogenophaga sp. TaxID=1904254 RepID=UPI0026359502|nr:DUF637 domain-containing protein [Hydrogenophaga sp.]MDM7943956.1 DUF637 domain-containing protein [Hydrogenophaga sp.]